MSDHCKQATGITLGLVGGALLGAGLMYVFDPDRGARRRGKIRDKAKETSHEMQELAERAGRDLKKKTKEVIEEVEHAFA
jgi:gas vesicle protein